MSILEKLTFGQTYVVQSDGPIKITQTGAHGTLVKVNVTDEAGTNGREVVFTAIDTAATVEVDVGTNWSCVPGFNRGAASVQGSAAELPAEQVAFLQAVTDGKLTFDADGRLQIATSVDAAGTFNHDGYASNYTKTVDGVKYTTTVSANEVKVVKRVGGVDTTVMHLANGDLALNGYAVVTEKGSTVEFLPDNPNYTMKQGATVQLTEYTDTLELLPSTLTTAQEMRVLYTPAEARTTPLIAVPDGVTLHWAGDEEPTWEAGKDYVIQLLQTAPTHIEARLFNAAGGGGSVTVDQEYNPESTNPQSGTAVAQAVAASPAVVPLASGADTVLRHGVIYQAEQSGELDLSGLTVAANATAEIRIFHDGNTIVFPESWVWGDSIFMKSLATPQGAPAMVAGQWYSFYVSAHPAATLISTGIIVAP